MNKTVKKDEELESPMIFWTSIGVAISASTATTMKFELLALIVSVAAGAMIGAAVGYFSKDKSKLNR